MNPDDLKQMLMTLASKRAPADATQVSGAPMGVGPAPITTQAPETEHNATALHHLMKAIQSIVNPTAGAELPNMENELGDGAEPVGREIPGQLIKDKFRNTTDPKEKARIKGRMSR